ncbi:MAG TPA: ABC transporter permease subunit [Solirubrobacteraceae bacterium]|jgi:phosphate transport system permease protein|nr:ABC transporter permease subunit [Solirubrobacteraceae bacterium]
MDAAGATLAEETPFTPPEIVRPGRTSTASWPLIDRLAHRLCWAVGIGLCLVTFALVLFMFLKGVSYMRYSLLVEPPSPSLVQSQSGGFRDPLLGSFIVTAIGILIAAPAGVAIAVWMSEYHRPAALARAVDLGVEMISGAPSVILALFGLYVFSRPFLGFLSGSAAKGTVTGQSFLTAGATMALLALPLIVGATREALAQVPDRMREASYALGKTPARTIRRVLLPAIRPGIAGGVVLGMGRIIGDTAIITVLLGGSAQRIEGGGGPPVIDTLRGTGSTLTSYVFYNSPSGEGNAPQKAYAAAFVLLIIVLLLNALVTRLTLGAGEERRRPSRQSVTRRLAWTR